MPSVSIIQSVLLIVIIVMLYWVNTQKLYPSQEYFAPVHDSSLRLSLQLAADQRSVQRVEDGTTADSHEDQFIISPNNLPTYALYQPNISGRHLNFFSHAPNTVPFYPDQLWTAQISDPYYQPAYKSYFYQEGYFYPLK